MEAPHQPEVIQHVTAGREVSQESTIKWFARCACGWESPKVEHIVVAQIDATTHERLGGLKW